MAGRPRLCAMASPERSVRADGNLRPALKSAGFLTRDARAKERKKPGLKRARKAKQYTKR